jgi:hypothetical protein
MTTRQVSEAGRKSGVAIYGVEKGPRLVKKNSRMSRQVGLGDGVDGVDGTEDSAKQDTVRKRTRDRRTHERERERLVRRR